jgi:4-amino-4-deoxy-L-arabinose transferase-like glycosyltransferase
MRDLLCIATVCLFAFVVLGKDIARGGLIDPDASAHVMDGVLIHDWLLAGPRAWLTPMRFAQEQYGHYPTLGIGGHYPPGFAVVEAGFFLIFGVSAPSARLCVVFFGVLAAVGCYVFVRPLADRVTAVIAAILLIALPASTQWGRQVMLEVPLMASLLWAAVAFSWYFRAPTWTRFAVMCLTALFTVLFKQTGVFLICALAMTLAYCALQGKIPKPHAAVVVLIAVAALMGMLLTLDDACLKTVSGYQTQAPWSTASILFYPRAIPGLVGRIVIVAALAGFALSYRRLKHHWWFLSAWVFVALVMVSVASLKTPRFVYVAVLPLVVWAAFATGLALNAIRWPTLRTATVAALVAYTGWAGFSRPVNVGPDFGPLVQACRGKIEDQIVLFSGLRDGDFVFAVREHIPWRRSVVIRGSKLFYTCIAGPDLDMVPYVNSPQELAQTMRRFAFTQVFVERDNLVGTQQDDWLRTYLRESGDYISGESVPVEGRENSCGRKTYVDVYSLARPWDRQVDHFDIPIPRTKNAIRIDLRNAGIAGDPS